MHYNEPIKSSPVVHGQAMAPRVLKAGKATQRQAGKGRQRKANARAGRQRLLPEQCWLEIMLVSVMNDPPNNAPPPQSLSLVTK